MPAGLYSYIQFFRHISDHRREMYELWGKWETTMGARDDDDLLFLLESFEETAAFAIPTFPASSETCDEDGAGMKQLTRAEKMAINI